MISNKPYLIQALLMMKSFELVLRNYSTLNQWNIKSLDAQEAVNIFITNDYYRNP